MKRSDVKNIELFKKYVSEKNNSINIKLWITFVLNIVVLYISLNLLREFIFEIYLLIGLIGTCLVGYSTFESGKSIVEYSSPKWDYNLDKAESLLKSKLYTGVGTTFLLTALLVGYYINYLSLTKQQNFIFFCIPNSTKKGIQFEKFLGLGRAIGTSLTKIS